jgi:hypothetical protein
MKKINSINFKKWESAKEKGQSKSRMNKMKKKEDDQNHK